MAEQNQTAEKLRQSAKRLFWQFGYSNVSVRQIARDSGADVALINRYFGSKFGLFEATLKDAGFDGEFPESEKALVAFFVELYASAPRGPDLPSAFALLLSCAQDGEVGQMVRDLYHDQIHAKIVALLKSKERAALFSAALLGFALAEKTLLLEGIASHDRPSYQDQLHKFLCAALSTEPGR